MSQTDLANEPFGRLPFDESLTVPTVDGIDLYVEIVEPADGVDIRSAHASRRPVPSRRSCSCTASAWTWARSTSSAGS